MIKKTLFLISIFVLALASACSKDKPKLKEDTATKMQEQGAPEETSDDPQAQFIQDFIAKNPDAIVRPDGLVIQVIKRGTGAIPTMNSFITANYHGTLIDGTVFDTTRDDGQPFSFPIANVIAGWQEALTLMREGAIYRIVVPADLGYGDKGAGDTIPPGATLIFEIELLKVTDPLRPEPDAGN